MPKYVAVEVWSVCNLNQATSSSNCRLKTDPTRPQATLVVRTQHRLHTTRYTDPYYARLARRDNNANVLGIGARVVAPEFALDIMNTWIDTPFEGGRHKQRIDLLGDYEARKPT